MLGPLQVPDAPGTAKRLRRRRPRQAVGTLPSWPRGQSIRHRCANLTSASLETADLSGADLSGATFVDAELSGVNLRGTTATLLKVDTAKLMCPCPGTEWAEGWDRERAEAARVVFLEEGE